MRFIFRYFLIHINHVLSYIVFLLLLILHLLALTIGICSIFGTPQSIGGLPHIGWRMKFLHISQLFHSLLSNGFFFHRLYIFGHNQSCNILLIYTYSFTQVIKFRVILVSGGGSFYHGITKNCVHN